ncbi:MAG: discoidin domain-containing protein [Sedimentisphaerales bacterium]|nr:discoidin domain-containing protein [Sedimentisphaerales bacterium]
MTHKLLILCVVLALGMCAAQVAQAQLIAGVEVRYSQNTPPQIVTAGLEEGAVVFVDRGYQYLEVPEFLLGADYVMLANDDKTNANFELDVTLARPATLYLFLDNRIGDDSANDAPSLGGSVMQWVLDMGFETTYEQIGVGDNAVWSTVYSLNVPAGTVTLYAQNDGGSRRMYSIAACAASVAADDPIPEDRAVDVPIDVILGWRAGTDAQAHDVYLGTVLADVNSARRADPLGVLVGEGRDANAYDPMGSLDFGQTYYWRVDEIGAGDSLVEGDVWSFTVEPRSIPIVNVTATASNFAPGYGPENTVNGSGLNEQDEHGTAAKDMWQSEAGAEEPVWIQYAFDRAYKLDELWVWNYNGDLEFLVQFGLKEVTVEHSMDGEHWTELGDFTFLQGTSQPGYTGNTTVKFGGVTAQYVRLVVQSSWGTRGQHGLSEVRFFCIPTYARQPSPASEATDVDTEVVLSWRAGRDATSHDVHLGTDAQTVADGTSFIDTVGENQYALSGLELDRTYYWRIDEVNEADAVISWAGQVWSFTTQALYVVDDFESYNDDVDGDRVIWQSWVDGYGIDDNGAQVGYDGPPYAERTVVREGRQSMPMIYTNTGGYVFSEAVRTFDIPQDWTRGGAQALVLYFQGIANNTTGRLYLKINDAPVLYDGAASDLTKAFWIQWTVDLAAVETDLTDVRKLTIGVDNGGVGTLYFDDIGLYRLAPQRAQEEVWIEAEAADSIVAPMRTYSDRADASGGAYIATFGDSSSDDPPDNGVASYVVRLSGGTYRIIGRVIAPTGYDDSFWVRLQGATTNTTNHVSGWVRWGLENGADWHEVPVQSMDDDNATVLFTVEPGVYNLEIAFREDGALLDNWIITQQLE